MKSMFRRFGVIIATLACLIPLPQLASAQGVDVVARGLGARAAVAGQLPRVQPSTIGMRIMAGRVYNAGFSTQTTYERLMAVSCPSVTAVKVVMVAGNTDGGTAVSPNMRGQIRAVPDTTDASSLAATNKQVQFSASATGVLTKSATSARRNFIISDWIPIRSVPRTDGGKYPLFVVRMNVDDGQIVVLGNGTQTFTAWATQPDGLISRMRHVTFAADLSNSGLWNQMSSGNATASNGSPIAGLIYNCEGMVVNIGAWGDSITEGQGTRIGEGWGLPAALALSNNAQGVTFEFSNFGWSGQTMSQIYQNVVDTLANGIVPDVAVVPSGSPNNIGNRAIVQTDIDGAAGAPFGPVIQTRALISAALLNAPRHIEPIWWTWLPTNSAVNNYGTSDSIRRADNDNVRAWATRGVIVADFDAKLAGVTTGGQVQMLAGSTTDNIHPNDTGNALLAPILVKAISRVTGVLPAGYLVVSELGSTYSYRDWLAANDNAAAGERLAA